MPKKYIHKKQSWFNELFEKDGSVLIHERNLQVLATEMYKFSNVNAPHERYNSNKQKSL